jgi:hypothetical protein
MRATSLMRASTVAFVAILALGGAASAQIAIPAPGTAPQPAPAPGTPVVAPPLEIGIQYPGEIPAGLAPLSLQIVPSIRNKGSVLGRLYAATPCEIHKWTLTDEAGEVVAQSPPDQSPGEICAQHVAEKAIAPGEIVSEPQDIVVPGGLVAGHTYRLAYRYWGLNAIARLTPKDVP